MEYVSSVIFYFAIFFAHWQCTNVWKLIIEVVVVIIQSVNEVQNKFRKQFYLKCNKYTCNQHKASAEPQQDEKRKNEAAIFAACENSWGHMGQGLKVTFLKYCQ